MRPPPHAARVAKGSWLVDSIGRTNGLGAATLSRMDCLGRPAITARSACPLHRLEGLDKRSIVRHRARSGNRPNMSWCSTQNRQDGFVLAVPKDYAKPLHRLQRFKTLAECNEAGVHAAFFRNISVRYGGTPQTISVSDAITRSFEPSTRGGAFRDLNVCVPPYPGDQRAMWQLLGLPGRRPHCHAHAELCTSLILRWKNHLHARAQILAQLRLGRTFVRSIPEAIIDIFGDLRLD